VDSKPSKPLDGPYRRLARFGDFQPDHLERIGLRQQPIDGFPRQDGTPFVAEALHFALPNALQNLELAFYKDFEGNILLGSTNTELHRHDRWLYLQPIESALHYHWYHADSDTSRDEPILDSIAERVISLLSALRERTSADMLQTYRLPSGIAPLVLELLGDGRISREDMHDMLFHYDAWVARNPQFADMPRDIVLRMQGFRPILDKLASMGMSLPTG
jgi:hypothetical protein